jgi:hypothetical protein
MFVLVAPTEDNVQYENTPSFLTKNGDWKHFKTRWGKCVNLTKKELANAEYYVKKVIP